MGAGCQPAAGLRDGRVAKKKKKTKTKTKTKKMKKKEKKKKKKVCRRPRPSAPGRGEVRRRPRVLAHRRVGHAAPEQAGGPRALAPGGEGPSAPYTQPPCGLLKAGPPASLPPL